MKRFSLLFLAMIFSLVPAFGQTKTIWEIGKFDQSAREFRAVPQDHLTYEAGKNDWAKDWPAEQRNGSTYEIQFDLPTVPQGVFQFKISALVSSPIVPALRVKINGYQGTYYFHPKPLYLGDQSYRSADVLTIDFPAKYLAKGNNRLILSLMVPKSENQPPLTARLTYDALIVTNEPRAKFNAKTIHAEVTPTIFYQREAGRLTEVVDAWLRFGQATPAGEATLAIDGQRYTAKIPASEGAGEQLLEFAVPQWQGTKLATLQVAAGVHKQFHLSLTAARKWTVFLVPHTHVDIGYTDYQGKVAEAQARTLDEAADLIKQYPDFRFATDGSWNLQQFLGTRSTADQKRILDLIREDKLGLPAQYVNLLTGYASLETLYRSLYYSKDLSRQYGLPFNYANTTDVPAYTGSYPSVLASAGIRYWVVGANNDRAPVEAHEQWNEKSPFWWEGPDGKKVLFWYSRGYSQMRTVFGFQPPLASVQGGLSLFLQPYSKPSYKPDAALIYGAQDENTDLHPDLATVATMWNQAYAYPKLQYATFADFFSYIEEHYGKELATYKGDLGPYWEDGIASDAYYAAIDRKNQSDVLSSETLSTVSHVVSADLHPPKPELDDAWKNIILFAEHTWTAGGSISQPDSEETVKQLAVKDNTAVQAKFELEDIANRSMSQLAHQIHIPARTLVVFNALNWKRSALVEADLPPNVELVDLTTHETVPVEVLAKKEGFVHVRFLASDLPSVGYKCFQFRHTSVPSSAGKDETANPVIENKYYRIEVDPQTGSVKSVFDKDLKRELVDAASPYRFGQYLYVTGGDGMTRMIHPFKAFPVAQLVIHAASQGEYLGTEKTAWGSSIKLQSSDTNTPEINLEILLYNNEKKIEFRYTVQKTYTTAKEGVYFAFPVDVTAPKFAYATQQGIVDPSRDLFKGASLEWFNIQKWMAVSDSHATVAIVPIDASLASFGDINRGEWPEVFQPKTSTLFSYAMNNYWHTNYRAGQGGSFTFRYVMTSADHLDSAALSRLGWESMEQPTLDSVINQDKVGDPAAPLPPDGMSFLDIDTSNIVLVTWKIAEDGKGTILRLQETAGKETTANIRLPQEATHSAFLCNSVEDKLTALPVSSNHIHLTFHPYEVLTVRLVP